MTQYKALRELSTILSCVPYKWGAASHVHIEEHDGTAKLRKVCLAGLKNNLLVFTPDSGRLIKKTHHKMSPLFSSSDGIKCNKACDAVVMEELSGGKLKITYIDLKSGRLNGVSDQFKSTICFVEYLRAILDKFHGIKLDIIQSRFVVLGGKKPLNKLPSRVSSHPAADPENPYIRPINNDDEIQAKSLIT